MQGVCCLRYVLRVHLRVVTHGSFQAMAVLRQARGCGGGVTHVAAATPKTADDLDALLGLR